MAAWAATKPGTAQGCTPCAGTSGRRRPPRGGASGLTAGPQARRASARALGARAVDAHAHGVRGRASAAPHHQVHGNPTRTLTAAAPSGRRRRTSRRCTAPGPAARPGWARTRSPRARSCRTRLRAPAPAALSPRRRRACGYLAAEQLPRHRRESPHLNMPSRSCAVKVCTLRTAAQASLAINAERCASRRAPSKPLPDSASVSAGVSWRSTAMCCTAPL